MLKYVDVFVITEPKLDDTFLKSQSLVSGFSLPFRLDQNRIGAGIKCLLFGTYDPLSQSDSYYFNNLVKALSCTVTMIKRY